MKKDLTPKNLQTTIFELLDNKKYDENLEAIKKAHKKEYFKQKHKEYKKKWKRVVLRFKHEDIADLVVIAKRHNLQTAPFLKACIYAYLKDIYVLPDSSQVTLLLASLNRIEQSVNQSLRYIHLSQNVSVSDIEVLKSKLHELEIHIERQFYHPPNLKLWLQDQINHDKRFIIRLKEILNEIDDDS